jgi:abhydrolase domain-containing protein 17
MGSLASKYIYIRQPSQPRTLKHATQTLHRVKSGAHTISVVTVVPERPQAGPPVAAILYAGGNTWVLDNDTLPELQRVADTLRVPVVSFEYTGYGDSSPSVTPTEAQTYADIRAAASVLPVPLTQTVVVGQSLGSGPACYLASQARVQGLVLVSPYTSMRDVAQRYVGAFLTTIAVPDVYRNIDVLPRVTAPVFIIHGVDDEVIPVAHGVRLAAVCTSHVSSLWVPGATHNYMPQWWTVPAVRRLLHTAHDKHSVDSGVAAADASLAASEDSRAICTAAAPGLDRK